MAATLALLRGCPQKSLSYRPAPAINFRPALWHRQPILLRRFFDRGAVSSMRHMRKLPECFGQPLEKAWVCSTESSLNRGNAAPDR
jgi:hypothetical protein